MLKITIIGNIGSDAQIKEFNGKRFVSFSVAHTERFTKADGTEVSTTTWISCLKRVGEDSTLAGYLKKGTQIYVRGTAGINAYTNSNGEMVAGLNCSVQELQLLGKKETTPAPAQEQIQEQVKDHLEKEAATLNDDLPF